MVSDRRSKFIGCVGDLDFSILGNVDPQTVKQINALADFAFYAGVGRKTPMGMGQVNRYQWTVISYQLSVISYQLSVNSYQLSVISYQLLEGDNYGL